MDTKDYLRILRNEIHSTVMATVNEDGHPVTRVIDTSDVPLVIRQEHCLHCGNCFRACPVGAVVKR